MLHQAAPASAAHCKCCARGSPIVGASDIVGRVTSDNSIGGNKRPFSTEMLSVLKGLVLSSASSPTQMATIFRIKASGWSGMAVSTGVLGFSGGRDPEGPIQQNSYSLHVGVEGGSVEFTGVAGASLAGVGVYGQVEDSPPVPTGWRAGVLGVASTQPGVIGFSREGDAIEGASFTGTLRAVSFF